MKTTNEFLVLLVEKILEMNPNMDFLTALDSAREMESEE